MNQPSSVRRFILAAYVVAACVLVFSSGSPEDIIGFAVLLALLANVAMPAFVGLLNAPSLGDGTVYHVFCIVVAGICISGYAWQWHVLFVGAPDALNGIVMLVVPWFQLAAVGVAFVIAMLSNRYVF